MVTALTARVKLRPTQLLSNVSVERTSSLFAVTVYALAFHFSCIANG